MDISVTSPNTSSHSVAPSQAPPPAPEVVEEPQAETRLRGREHAINQGNGNKYGLRRQLGLPDPRDIATLQQEAGVSPPSDEGAEGGDPVVDAVDGSDGAATQEASVEAPAVDPTEVEMPVIGALKTYIPPENPFPTYLPPQMPDPGAQDTDPPHEPIEEMQEQFAELVQGE